MYLTEEEFVILSAYKMNLTNNEILKYLGIRIYTNDPRVDSLLQKYGVCSRFDLVKLADLNKVEVCDIKNIPYFTSDDDKQLVNVIRICKKDVNTLANIFETVQDENKVFDLVQCSNTLNEYLCLRTDNTEEYIYQRIG